MSRLKLYLPLMVLLGLSACSKPGVNAGKTGGIAFIWFSVMLIVTALVMWFFLGRED